MANILQVKPEDNVKLNGYHIYRSRNSGYMVASDKYHSLEFLNDELFLNWYEAEKNEQVHTCSESEGYPLRNPLKATVKKPLVFEYWYCYRHPESQKMTAAYQQIDGTPQQQFADDEIFLDWLHYQKTGGATIRTKRIRDTISVIDRHVSGLTLQGQSANTYIWLTRPYGTSISFAEPEEQFHVSMTVHGEDNGKLLVKNVRILKEKTNE